MLNRLAPRVDDTNAKYQFLCSYFNKSIHYFNRLLYKLFNLLLYCYKWVDTSLMLSI